MVKKKKCLTNKGGYESSPQLIMRRNYLCSTSRTQGGRNTHLAPSAHLFGDMPWRRGYYKAKLDFVPN
nr:MAG TPA: hypothetical protein [Caudoviricetes sp.]